MSKNIVALAIALAIGVARAANAGPIGIDYLATDLADTVSGQDLWRYTYRVTGPAFPVNQGFSVFFDYVLYASLQLPPAPVTGWDVSGIQPDPSPGLESDGLFDALAIVNAPSLTEFVVNFVWRGTKALPPGSQGFEVYQLVGSNVFSVASGLTTQLSSTSTTPVPEPSSLLLLATGALSVVRRLTRARASRERTVPAGLLADQRTC